MGRAGRHLDIALRLSAQIYCLLIGVGVLACQHQQWDVASKLRAPDVDVAAALGDTTSENSQWVVSDIPEIPYPRALRPCCAFGADLEVAVGSVPVPGVELGNLLGPEDLGPHRYDNGALSVQRADPRGIVGLERNGLIYTCRGGFIDLAHVRDNADNTLAIAAAVARTLEETGTTIELPPQGAAMRIRVRPVPTEAIAKHGRMRLAVSLAQWLAYEISIWHEIATFYGYTAIAAWPERISAFSPEDLYSNELGIRIAGGVILAKEARSDLEYGLGLDAWLERTLQRLEAVPLEDSRAAMQAVDGAWWPLAARGRKARDEGRREAACNLPRRRSAAGVSCERRLRRGSVSRLRHHGVRGAGCAGRRRLSATATGDSARHSG